MATLLKIDVSPRGDNSISRKLSNHFATEWQSNHVGGEIVTRDLATTKIPFVDLTWIAGVFTPPDKRSHEHTAALSLSDEFIAEILAADDIVISTPLYNFSTPAALKAWLDHIVRVNKTFFYGPEGPKGLLGSKNLTIIIASGRDYAPGSPNEAFNFGEPYLRVIFSFMGITDPTVIHAGDTASVAQRKVTESEFIEKYIHQVDLAASR
jgi:FMN-dependent NADH-azoreductase